MNKNIKVVSDDFPQGYTSLIEFCHHTKSKNLVVLHLLEEYLGESLSSNDELINIRKIILDVSGNINRLPYNMFIEGDEVEKL